MAPKKIAVQKPNNVPKETATKVDVNWLKLDIENPRLVGFDAQSSDESIIAQLYREEELGELLQSIAANGYLDIEPLIVLLDASDQRFIVLEGNRRLAAIRLFRETGLKEAIASKTQVKIPVPEIDEQKKVTFEKISVYRVESRDDARSFIGFKHINGAAKWDSYAKAKFAAEWYRNGKTDLQTISEQIGDKHDTIKRMVAAIYVLEQAERENVFSLSDRASTKFNFSHLYTALSRRTYMKFLGLDTAWATFDPKPDPVPTENIDRLREVLVWIYGSKSDNSPPVVLSQNPDVKRLGEVLENTEALHILRDGSSLENAHASTRAADETLASSLIRARSMLRDAANSLRGYDGKDSSLLNIAADVNETAQTIYERMKKKSNDALGGEGGS